jgi:hypothetical protein
MDMNGKPLRTKDLNRTKQPDRPLARPPRVVFEQRPAAVRRGVSAAVLLSRSESWRANRFVAASDLPIRSS